MPPCPRHAVRAAAVVIALSAAGCASAPGPVAAVPSTAACRPVLMRTIAGVARRAYAEVATGRLIATSRIEVTRARTLARAIAADDPAAATAAARGLLARTQIAFLRVTRRHRVLVDLGQGPAIARAAGLLHLGGRVVGRYVLAVQGDGGYAAVVHGLTGAAVLVRAGSQQLAGTLAPGPASIPERGQLTYGGVPYSAVSFTAHGYPGGHQRVSVLVGPSLFGACAATPAQTEANVLGPLAVRVYAHEAASHSEHTAVAYISRSTAFTAAVAEADPAQTRAAIIAFFRSHRHIVRVRALRGTRVVDDVGGPWVLAPVAGTLRAGGRVIGSFLTAIQDDAGYVALTHIYSGADVILRVGARTIPSSTLYPGPPSIPDRGPVAYGGRRYEAFSFDGRSFPGGVLRISVLVPASA